ncbi:MAG: hypothetical protein KBD21_02250 [Candidatus Pacebacteria bacterium]|nr:hypothetical protein [Candidatus Paceibacterota bacterium]
MNNQNLHSSAIAVIAILILVSGGFFIWNSHKIEVGEKPDTSNVLTEKEARILAEASCIKGGGALSGGGTYNPNSKTWWFDANLNATEGCNPACVVSEETQNVEINWRCTGLVPPAQADPATPSISEPPVSDSCGIENCHGLDIVCGKPAEVCTMMYQLGDTCRQYAQCGQVNGTCQQIENPQFSRCKSCVQKCENDFPNDPDNAFVCESKCGEQ